MTIIRYLDGTVINLNDIGIRTIDFDVPSPNYINHFETIEGKAGVGYLGSDVGPRNISLRCRAVAKDQIDFPFLRSEIFNLIPTHEEFYISEGHWSSVQWLVRPANGFDVDKLNLRTIFTIPFVGIEGYAQSVYTSLELHDSGYTAGSGTVPSGLTSSNYETLFGGSGNSQLLASDIQKLERDLNILKRDVNRYEGQYGLVDGIDDEKVKYRFEGIPYNQNLMSAPYDYRKQPNDHNVTILGDGLPAGTYTISFEYIAHDTPNGLSSFLVYAGSPATRVALDNYVSGSDTRIFGTFTISSSQSNIPLQLYAGNNAAQSLNNDVSFNKIKIESGSVPTPFVKPTNLKTSFTVFNAGNVLVEPEFDMLNITIGYVENATTFRLENKTTGDVFEINKHLNGRNVYIRGVSVTEGGSTNILRDTNKRFISLAPGNNEFEVTGGLFSQISFDFRFKYK